MEYRNIDVERWPQETRVEWEKIVLDDDDASPFEFLDRDDDAERIAAWRNGEWRFIGIQAKATIYVPIGGTSFTVFILTSPGLFGIESDSGKEYLQSVYDEEVASLKSAIREMANAPCFAAHEE